MLKKSNTSLQHQTSASRVYFVLLKTYFYNISLRKKSRLFFSFSIWKMRYSYVHQFHLYLKFNTLIIIYVICTT